MAQEVVESVEETEDVGSPAEQHHESIKADINAAWDKMVDSKEPEAAEEEAPAPKPERARDESGKFVKKEEAPAEAAPPKGRKRQAAQAELEVPTPEAPKPAAKPDPVENLPASFKPENLEAWKSLPRGLKEEIHRRENEQAAFVAQTKPIRQFVEEIQKAAAPYAALIQAEGGSIPSSLANYYQAATLMRQGAPQAKAQWIAKLVKTFTAYEHLELLDKALQEEFGINGANTNGRPAQPAYQPQEFRDPRVDQLLAAQEQAREQWLQQGLAEARSEKDAWVAEKNPEFLPWVQKRMASLMETAARDGEDLSFDEAYDAACRTNPQVRAILQQREEASRAQAAAVQKSKKANVSIRPQGNVAPVSGGEVNSTRRDIEEAWDSIMGR